MYLFLILIFPGTVLQWSYFSLARQMSFFFSSWNLNSYVKKKKSRRVGYEIQHSKKNNEEMEAIKNYHYSFVGNNS